MPHYLCACVLLLASSIFVITCFAFGVPWIAFNSYNIMDFNLVDFCATNPYQVPLLAFCCRCVLEHGSIPRTLFAIRQVLHLLILHQLGEKVTLVLFLPFLLISTSSAMMDKKLTCFELNTSTHTSQSDIGVYEPHDDWKARSPPLRQDEDPPLLFGGNGNLYEVYAPHDDWRSGVA